MLYSLAIHWVNGKLVQNRRCPRNGNRVKRRSRQHLRVMAATVQTDRKASGVDSHEMGIPLESPETGPHE